jgi:hypothetical protein
MVLKDNLQARKAKERKLRKHKDLLLQSVQTHILPVFVQHGFSVTPGTRRGPDDRKSADTFPFELRRARPDGGVDLVEIQFMTYQRAAFRINAGMAPREGMMTVTGHRSAEEVCVHWLNEFFEMYASSRWRSWFSLWLWRFRTPVQSDYDKLALRVAGFLPEVELALREGKLGPHMRRVMIPRREPHLPSQGTTPSG